MTRQPTLHVFAGPNGAGKSTLFAELSNTPFFQAVQQVNGDVIYKDNPHLTQDELAVVVAERIKSHFERNESFSIESNLATSANYTVLRSAHAKGYKVSLYYVCLRNPDVCRDRVKDRVSKGGHDVPFSIIEHRYKNALSLIKRNYLLFNNIDFIDNSAGSFTSVLRVESGKIIYQQAELPDWAAGVAKHIGMMEKALLKTNP